MARKKKLEATSHTLLIKNYPIPVVEQGGVFLGVPAGSSDLSPSSAGSLEALSEILSMRMRDVLEAPDPASVAVYRGPIFRVMKDGSTFVDLGRIRAKLVTASRKDLEVWTSFWEMGQDSCCAEYPMEDSKRLEDLADRLDSVSVNLKLVKVRVLGSDRMPQVDAEFPKPVPLLMDLDHYPTYHLIKTVITSICPNGSSRVASKELGKEFRGSFVGDSDVWDLVDPDSDNFLKAEGTAVKDLDSKLKWLEVEISAMRILTANSYDLDEFDLGWPDSRSFTHIEEARANWGRRKQVIEEIYGALA